MDDCIFCKIISGQLPANIVYDCQNTIGFLDIRPISDGHTIVVPKKHIPDLESLEQEELNELITAVKAIGLAMIRGLGVKGYSVFLDNKSAANQHVPHVHFHIVPRAKGDGLDRWPQQNRYEDKVAELCAEKIKDNLIIVD